LLCVALGALLPGAAPAAPPTAAPAAAAVQLKAADKGYQVAPGLTLTNADDNTDGKIIEKIGRAVANTPRGEKILGATWNFDSKHILAKLQDAHKRGVTVQIIMARTRANSQGGDGAYAKLKRTLSGYGNNNRKAKNRSWIRTCDQSCRGKRGSMHAKFYLFSKAGQSKRVVMNTSANLTGTAASVQWNDLFTTVDRPITWRQYKSTFEEMKKDKPAPYREYRDGEITGFFFPLSKRTHPVMRMLNQVKCKGAKKVGVNGRTSVRVAQDVFNDQVGLRIAEKLKQLHNQGCSVRVVYSQAVRDSRPVIQSLPNRHLVQDNDRDGEWDVYLHAKVLAIAGHYGDDRSKQIVLNGSANWSGTGVQSDEQGMIIEKGSIQVLYRKWIDKMFTNDMPMYPNGEPLPDDGTGSIEGRGQTDTGKVRGADERNGMEG
jgi:phosphatidylserine/phosphatidylglycerophosphate/cardiolipin synthase-like enzyme